jgi:hypothetical protein
MFKKLLFVLGFLWVLPVSILVWVFWMIPKYFQGTFAKVTVLPNLLIVWDVKNDSDFFKKSMKGWYGFVAGCNIVVVDYDNNLESFKQHMAHETTHGIQNYIFGVLFYPLYLLCTLCILVFMKNLHAYHDNPFERWARRSAGQRVNIPKSEWMNGPNDRFPWN